MSDLIKIGVMSNGCETMLTSIREIIAGDPSLQESSPENAHIILVSFCVISQDHIVDWVNLRNKALEFKKQNPRARLIAGGCIEGLPERVDLSFADMTFERHNVAEVLHRMIEEIRGHKVAKPPLAPFVFMGAAQILIEEGCNKRCSFCKSNYLNCMAVKSRPESEVLALVHQALDLGLVQISLIAENSTEYGYDLGTNLVSLLRKILALEKVRFLDIGGICLDEIDPELLEVLKHPKVRRLQLEIQSLNDTIRKNMRLIKTSDEILAILDALSDKPIYSGLMTCFPGHSIKEFERELNRIKSHHLYFLEFNKYDDTPGTPSYDMHVSVTHDEESYYTKRFMDVITSERKRLIDRLSKGAPIEATVVEYDSELRQVRCVATHYAAFIELDNMADRYHIGDVVHVKISKKRPELPKEMGTFFKMMNKDTPGCKFDMDIFNYIDPFGQHLTLVGEVVSHDELSKNISPHAHVSKKIISSGHFEPIPSYLPSGLHF